MTEQKTVQAKMPWAGTKSNGAYTTSSDYHAKGGKERFDHFTEVCERRTPAQRASLLEARLSELRSDPPRGFPR